MNSHIVPTRNVLRTESFLVFDMSKVNLSKWSLDQDERKLKNHIFLSFLNS